MRVNAFTLDVLSPYGNYQRPCFFPRITLDENGRQHRLYRYQDMMTPFDKLASLATAEQHLKSGISLAALQTEASIRSDSDAARPLNRAKPALFERIFKPRKSA